MATLLHIDSSVFPGEASSSRSVADAFRKAWQEQHPQGTVIYRDLAASPVPHITADAWSAGYAAPCEHTPGQSAAFAARVELIEELEQADAVLIGAPMYNYSIPSTLKAWLDNVLLLGRTAGPAPSAQGTPAVVVASRGGSYAPGTPREGFEFVQNYLEAVLQGTLGLDLDFIVPELTMAPRNPAMSELVPLYEASRERAFQDASAKAKQLAKRLAA
ncbi:NAD(P)H-dependent oxidoreductase (plasmid) [Streptomyces sp. NBC_01340]|uniref:FMN-dependent NADH-azoreductase n=1 Tax=unclassified Streptomyces TaxID=2593676 RepID=UPI00224C95E8|nr:MULTISPECIES: NAD(P)H-dependent oxidoreductase [unclassified Streptomyces]MCX4462361.1 NAD(P)H-dependent oxidoreductase [Streptomyces sp. NBC_01719]MCX4499437.1 NAD(P)H-dependent oxidoreductase [Streptomyces sp. NBC_01728]MCX4500600.1 NAD(P)H-dependent oxidoreductase [Streptomyces sp. NBC_01728]MCX4500799.1 NAD(P)H-dependent oxidoreductase [Streptomyces sp. NBC_01728]MCX4594660.1 NAD(P)H-dependent oxidoreductase [Streptomyces sp. NBC_01549]